MTAFTKLEIARSTATINRLERCDDPSASDLADMAEAYYVAAVNRHTVRGLTSELPEWKIWRKAKRVLIRVNSRYGRNHRRN